MCLDLVLHVHPTKPLEHEQEGYKVGLLINSPSGSSFQTSIARVDLEFNMWHTATHTSLYPDPDHPDYLISAVNREIYHVGFHIFTKLEDAKTYNMGYDQQKEQIVKVKYRKTVANGVENHWRNGKMYALAVDVAKEMMIEEVVVEEIN